MTTKWGFLRETKELAQAAGIDKDTGYHRTGLEDYLKVIFPDVSEDEWVHNKAFGKHNGKTLPQIKECDSGWIAWAKENISREPVKSLLAQM